ncbi:hypothetical protein A2154_04920 [Candidatus Gottesmanbacteria bacterium RBG_16_43_7]|uniref:Uncharacterized protein n=1 Tax=Candidatus Gottesmanbacteria bacterium RBG_16_43_7 TaxID=1798373 RepID=A0A1F5Z9R3_9BACT|nr:MAG: hypothetical protein A2154_04920 [Candidatus Gottesmanbacteria bacterium RBG_16_43_7]
MQQIDAIAWFCCNWMIGVVIYGYVFGGNSPLSGLRFTVYGYRLPVTGYRLPVTGLYKADRV